MRSTHEYIYIYLRRSCDPEERGGTLRECVRAKRTCETQEDKERGLSRNSEREPERRARETQQERERRDLEHARERMRAKRTSETQEDRERRLNLNRERERERTARETHQERERRDLEHARELMRAKRTSETQCYTCAYGSKYRTTQVDNLIPTRSITS